MINGTKMDLYRNYIKPKPASYLLILSLISVHSSICIASGSAEESHKEGTKEHHWHKNHVALFVGGMTPVNSGNELSFAIGLDYERRFTEAWGLELRGDYTVGSHERTALVMTNLTFRPFGEVGLKIMTGPGFEIEDEEGHSKTLNFVYGVGAAWEFHLGKVSIAPKVYADFLGESKTNITFGIGFGTGF